MNSRERVKTIFAKGTPDRSAFWLGQPHPDALSLYLKHFGVPDERALRRLLGDDYVVCSAEYHSWKHPQGRPMFDNGKTDPRHGAEGVLAHTETVAEVDAFPWPNPDYLDFTEALEQLDVAGDLYRAGGMWCCFFHEVSWFMGLENHFVKMHTHPEVVDAITRHICEFCLEANERFYRQAGDRLDGFFLGNDFGTQLDLLISPQDFDHFILPWLKQLVDQAHSYGYQVIMHSCGAVHKLIDRYIAVGIDALHPLQAKAVNMDAESLARDFKGRIAFVGGIDTQDLLVNATPAEVRAEVRRVKRILGPQIVIGPSHETLLPNVPPENVLAMAEAAREEL